jgi:hypothetical protein
MIDKLSLPFLQILKDQKGFSQTHSKFDYGNGNTLDNRLIIQAI